MDSNPNTRLKSVFKELPVTYDSIAEESGISKSTWQRAMSNDGHIGIDLLVFLSEHYGVDSNFIVKGEYSQLFNSKGVQSTAIDDSYHYAEERLNEEGEPWDPDEFVVIPFYHKVYASAGDGRVTENETFVDIAFRKYFFRNTVYTDWRNCFMIRMKGDSMYPVYPDGCELLIDEGRRKISEGPGYVVTIGDQVFCKIIRNRPDGKIELQSLNEMYKPMVIDPKEEGFKIIGQVIWHAQISKYI